MADPLATSGTAPGSVSVTIVPSALPSAGATAGTYDGQVVLQTTGDVVATSDQCHRRAQCVRASKPHLVYDARGFVRSVASESGYREYRYCLHLQLGCVHRAGRQLVDALQPWRRMLHHARRHHRQHHQCVCAAGGTYSGEIVFTQYFQQTLGLTVPVTLTVVGTGTPFSTACRGN